MTENKRPTHFFVTAIQSKTDARGEFKSRSHCAGYTDSLKDAEEAVLENIGDMSEGGTNGWIVIEKYQMGVYASLVGIDIVGEGCEKWYQWKA
jgi:hypothetical protein